MHRSLRIICLLTLAAAFAGCATSGNWAVTDSDRHEGLVRVSYEYQEFQEPRLSAEGAAQLAQNRCTGWGYDDAEPIAGQLRQCSNMNNGNCDFWKVTREFQCTREVAMVELMAR